MFVSYFLIIYDEVPFNASEYLLPLLPKDERLPGRIRFRPHPIQGSDGYSLPRSYKWEALSGAEHTAIIADVPTTKAVRARIIVLANVPRDLLSTVSTYDEFQTRLVDLSSQSQTNLTMSSQVIVTKSTLSEEDNYLGYTDLGDQNVDGISDPERASHL